MRVCWFVVAMVLLAVSADAELVAGAGKRSIVPPFPTHMGGFGDRLGLFEGVHDPLFVRALVLENEGVSLVVLGSGLMNLDDELADRVGQGIFEKTGIARSNVMVSSAHNHSAPSYYQYATEAEKAPLRDFLVGQFVAAAVEAYEQRVPAKLGYRAGELSGVTRNRQQNNEVVIDTQVGVLRVEELEGRATIATLFNFTGHPVIVGAQNLHLSGEWPGAACRTVEQVLGGVALFTQGACGDITVHRSGDPFLEVARLGRVVAGEVIKTAELIRPSGDAPLAAAFERISLRRKTLPPAAELRVELEEAVAAHEAAERDGAPKAVTRSQEQRVRMLRSFVRQATGLEAGTLEVPETYAASMQVMRIGGLVLAAVPGEIFVEYALELRQRTLQATGLGFCLVGYANGYVGYIVTPRAMETGGYESSVARVDSDSGRVLTEAAMSQILKVVR